MRWARHVVRILEERQVFKVSVGKPKGKIPLGRPKCRCGDGIRLDFWQNGWSIE
jgi:hypothetical protein